MPKGYPGMTVAEAIEQLKLLPPDAVLTLYGDCGYYLVGSFEPGTVYQTGRGWNKDWSFAYQHDELPKYCKKFDAVVVA